MRAMPWRDLPIGRVGEAVLGVAVSLVTACGTNRAPAEGASHAGPDSGIVVDAGPLGDAGSSADGALPVDSGAMSHVDSSVGGSSSVTLKFVAGSAYSLYATVGSGTAHEVQLDTGSTGLYVPKSVVGAGAQISATATCSITYVSSGTTLSGHQATGVVTLLGSTAAGDVPTPPSTTSMPFCAIDDPTFHGGMMGVGFGRSVSDPKQNVLLQMQDVVSGTMEAGYVLSTHPSPSVQIGITAARAQGFQMVSLTPQPSGNGDWVATSLRGCVTLPQVSAFTPECGGLLVDTGIAETILWGPKDPTLGGTVASGATAASPGTAFQIATESGSQLDFTFTLGSGTDTPSAVDLRSATAFSINTGRALLVDYDYLFDAKRGVVGFEKM